MVELKTNDIVVINYKLYKYFLTIEGSWTITNIFVSQDLDIIKVKDLEFANFVRDNVKAVYKSADDNPKSYNYKVEPNNFTLSDLYTGLHITFRDGIAGDFKNNRISRLEGFGIIEEEKAGIFGGMYFPPKHKHFTEYNYINPSDYRDDLRHKTIKAFDIVRVSRGVEDLYIRAGIKIPVIKADKYFKIIRKDNTK